VNFGDWSQRYGIICEYAELAPTCGSGVASIHLKIFSSLWRWITGVASICSEARYWSDATGVEAIVSDDYGIVWCRALLSNLFWGQWRWKWAMGTSPFGIIGEREAVGLRPHSDTAVNAWMAYLSALFFNWSRKWASWWLIDEGNDRAVSTSTLIDYGSRYYRSGPMIVFR
jgi:hypothetical protein